MRVEEKRLPVVFESTDLTKLIGIPPIQLNKFIERGQYGVRASIRTGRGRGRRRLFSQEDVFGVALVWWLFESGFRSPMIQRILNDICEKQKFGTANEATNKLLAFGAEALLIQRKPRTAAYAVRQEHRTPQKVDILREPDVFTMMQKDTGPTTILLRVGNLFASLKKAMEAL
jgi:hypothetical protein